MRFIPYFLLFAILLFFLIYILGLPTKDPLLSTKNNEPYSVVILGDSLGVGVGASSSDKTFVKRVFVNIRTVHPNATLTNLAITGSTTKGVANDQLPFLEENKPKVILLVVGTNDIIFNLPDNDFRETYSHIVETLTKTGASVLILNIPKFVSTPLFPASFADAADTKAKEHNQIIKDLVSNNPSITLFDFYTYSEKELLAQEQLLYVDNFHPNDEGYKRIADALIPLLPK